MSIRIAINGFGRIGRCVARLLLKDSRFELVAVNDLVPADNLAYLLKYDTVHGTYSQTVRAEKDRIHVGSASIKVLEEKDPAKLPWKDLSVDYVLEATGRFTNREDASLHLAAGAKRVVISAPAKEGVATYVVGVNHKDYRKNVDFVVSVASCTTNCLAPMCKVLMDSFGIEEGLMTTVHSLTATQPVVDGPSKKDWRGGRAAGANIIPSSTGAAKAVALCLPQLKGKLTGMAFRIPTLDVSVVDLTVRLVRDATYEEICHAFTHAASTNMKGILAITDEQVVSSDFIGSVYSCVIDKAAGITLSPRFHKIVGWYDNEMGYSHRVVDLLDYMESQEK